MYDEILINAKIFVINDEIIFETMLQIHKKIKQARLSASLTESQMAEKLGIERTTYQYWEKKTPSLEKIKMVASVLNLEIDYFLGSNDKLGSNIKTTDLPEMANEIMNLKAVIQVLVSEIAAMKEDYYNQPAEHWLKDMDKKRRIEFQRLGQT